MEQRYDAVMGVIRDGFNVTEIAEKFGVTRQTVHSWLRRYEAGGLEGLADHTHRPKTCPHQMAGQVEARLLELRRLHPFWGPARLVHQLEREGAEAPSKMGAYRALVRR